MNTPECHIEPEIQLSAIYNVYCNQEQTINGVVGEGGQKAQASSYKRNEYWDPI